MKHNIYAFIVIFLLISCTQKIPTANDNTSEVFFTDFSGEKIELENSSEYQYVQTISWEENLDGDPLFAYRFTTTNNEIPEGFCTDENGWIYHYLPGADESIPLCASYEKSIWTDKKSLEITFESVNGELAYIISEVELKYLLDNEASDVISTGFFDFRIIGTRLTTMNGSVAGRTIGRGITFTINEKLTDIFVEGLYADHFMYRLNIISEADSSLVQAGEWMNTLDCEDIRKVEMNSELGNALEPNEDGELTELEAYIVTRSGFEDIDNPAKMNFKVQDGFYPNTLIYNGILQSNHQCTNNSFALGEYHFVTYLDEALSAEPQHTYVNDMIHYATAPWIDKNGNYVMIGSDDLEFFLNCGYSGEYVVNNPANNYYGIVIDELTGVNYYSSINYIDYRLDNEPWDCEEFPAGEYTITDDDGTEWLRIPYESEAARHPVLRGLSYGEHTFTARVVDSQIEPDATPSNYTFNVVAPVPKEEKEGILILCDTPFNQLMAPEELLDSLYSIDGFFAGYNGVINKLSRRELRETVWNSALHFSKDVFSATDLQNYKLIVYYSDIPHEANCNFASEYDVMNLYLQQGGNIILSGGKNIAIKVQIDCINYGFPILENYFGIPLDINSIQYPTFEDYQATFFDLAFFDNAISNNVYADDINLLLPSFNFLVNNVEALGPVSYFNNIDPSCEVLYGFGCRVPEVGTLFEEWDDVDDEDVFPSLNQFNMYNNKPIALRKITENNSCYIFGFPLSYMEVEDVNNMMLQILNELGM